MNNFNKNKSPREKLLNECKNCKQQREIINLSDISFEDVRREFTFKMLEFGGGRILHCKGCDEYSFLSNDQYF